MTWFDLWRIRRTLFPVLDRVVPDRVYDFFVSHTPLHEYAGTVDTDPQAVRERLLSQPYTYANNLAAQRVVQDEGALAKYADEIPCYCVGSYAHRADGRFGKWQTHIRLFATVDGRTAVFAHREQNPLYAPRKHLEEVGFNADFGRRTARDLLDLERKNDIPTLTNMTETKKEKSPKKRGKNASTAIAIPLFVAAARVAIDNQWTRAGLLVLAGLILYNYGYKFLSGINVKTIIGASKPAADLVNDTATKAKNKLGKSKK